MSRRVPRVLASVLGLILVSCAAQAWAQSQPQRRFITIGTGGPSGIYFSAGNAICRLIHKEAGEGRSEGRAHGLRCSAPQTGGSLDNIRQIADHQIDFGLVQSDLQYLATRGTAPEKVTPFDGLRSVFSLHAEPVHVVVGKAAGITRFEELKGKRVHLGSAGSGQRATLDMLLRAHGMTVESLNLAADMTPVEQTNALCEAGIDAFGMIVGVPNSGIALAVDGCGATLLNLDGPVEKRLMADMPFYAPTTIPAGTYRTLRRDVQTFGVLGTLVTSIELEEFAVYELTRSVMENIADFRLFHPAFARLEPRQMIRDGLTAPLHPGAARYYKEKGWL
jgi:hypothetical protein